MFIEVRTPEVQITKPPKSDEIKKTIRAIIYRYKKSCKKQAEDRLVTVDFVLVYSQEVFDVKDEKSEGKPEILTKVVCHQQGAFFSYLPQVDESARNSVSWEIADALAQQGIKSACWFEMMDSFQIGIPQQ